jgi:hypothetical protein
MFSVDNFYDFFVAEYGHKKTNNFIMTYQPHGSKDLHNLEPYGIKLADCLGPTGQENLKQFKRIVMHDQEPLFLDYVDTYRKTLDNQKNLLTQNPRQLETLNRLKIGAKDGNVVDYMRRKIKNQAIKNGANMLHSFFIIVK